MTEPRGRHFVLAFSGGLDTSYCLAVLVDRGERVTTVTVDTGGFSAEELERIRERARQLGAAEHLVVDGRARLYEQFVSYILKADYLRNGVYPSCVGVERMLQAEEVTRVALERGADAIAHGSTGAGNDHVRFDAVARALAPALEIHGLIRDERRTREEERDFLRARGHAVSDLSAAYSFNFGILGTTIGGEETYGSWEYLPEQAWPTTRSVADAPDEPAELIVRFERGLPCSLERVDGRELPALGERSIGVAGYDVLATLNLLGAEHGVGRGIHTGQTIMGIAGRLGFEAPGMLTLIAAHRELERLVLTNAQQAVKATLGQTFGDMLHEGRYYEPLLDDIRAFLDSSQARVSGDVRIRLHKGNVVALGARSPHSLLDAGRALGSTYGHGSSLWTGEDARAFAHIYATAGLVARAAAGGG
ncbi:MAG TPA: argininosuccinate synthase domain-containing protein [Solirubrobacteraceae bacterium]|nr:argininosuccinate synthase domain-containing protein [Solirubrobacteraceae bacterium]